MDFVDPILSLATTIYSLVENVKANKKRCQRVVDRIRPLEGLLRSMKERKAVQASADVKKALKELKATLKFAQMLIEKYTSTNWAMRFLKSSSHTDEFSSLNKQLNDSFQILALALQLEHGNAIYAVFEALKTEREDREDGEEDDAQNETLLLEYVKETNILVNQILDFLTKPKATCEDIRKIRPEELKFIPDLPKKPFMTTPTSEVYRGQYRGFPVAIKRYTGRLNTDISHVEATFKKEADAMKRYESPNILRIFGICLTPKPEFFLIMEYCEKGSLRDVLNSSCELSWARKACMSLHAAQGLYQLHRTDEKSGVHGDIDSTKFLVAEGYVVKLGGFELTKTETSLGKMSRDNEITSLCYSSPEMLSDINCKYSKECEMYSLGIVLWEIATRKKPFEDCSSDDEINDKVRIDKYQEPLPPDCPTALAELIDACRAYESFERPSAEVLVNKLHRVVLQLEEQ